MPEALARHDVLVRDVDRGSRRARVQAHRRRRVRGVRRRRSGTRRRGRRPASARGCGLGRRTAPTRAVALDSRSRTTTRRRLLRADPQPRGPRHRRRARQARSSVTCDHRPPGAGCRRDRPRAASPARPRRPIRSTRSSRRGARRERFRRCGRWTAFRHSLPVRALELRRAASAEIATPAPSARHLAPAHPHRRRRLGKTRLALAVAAQELDAFHRRRLLRATSRRRVGPGPRVARSPAHSAWATRAQPADVPPRELVLGRLTGATALDRARQLRAPPRRRADVTPSVPRRRVRGRRASSPRAASRSASRASRSSASRRWRCPPSDADAGSAREAVRLFVERATAADAALHARRRRITPDRGRDLPAARRHPARHRARRRPRTPLSAGRDRAPARRPVPPP